MASVTALQTRATLVESASEALKRELDAHKEEMKELEESKNKLWE